MTDSTGDARKPKVLRLDNTQSIAYLDEGSGQTLLFVHGSLCDYRYWKPQLLGMSNRFHVVTPSLSHYYPRLPSMVDAPFSWLAHTNQIAAFIRRLDAGPVHLVGHSRGASIAYQVALRHPQWVNRLMLVDPAGPNDKDEAGAGAQAAQISAIRDRAAALISRGMIDEGLELFVDSTSRPGFWNKSARQFQDMARDNADSLILQFSDPLPAYAKTEAAALSCPTLLVDGARSPATYRDNARILHEWLPRARRTTIAGASHGMTWSHAEVFNQSLQRFLATPQVG
jgi:pimeloyl-ACP methyl ester carboxylesterase